MPGDQQIGDDIGGNTEQSGMAERHQSGITNQNIEPEREYRIEQNLTRDIHVIHFFDRVRHHRQPNDRDCDGNSPRDVEIRHRIWPPNRPCGRNTKTSTIGRNRMK